MFGSTPRAFLFLVSSVSWFVTTDVSAQNLFDGEGIFGSGSQGCPTCQIDRADRPRIVCDARLTAYQNQNCDRSCTDECKRIGTSLRECAPPRIVACVQ